MTQDKRAHFRKLLQSEAWIVDASGGHWCPLEFLDISPRGMSLVTRERLIVEASYRLHFTLPDGVSVIECMIKIMSRMPIPSSNDFRIGAQFLTMSAHDTALVKQFVEAAL